IPFARDPESAAPAMLIHVGIYAFRASALRRFISWQPSPLEAIEKLEQLRALEHGLPIRVIRTPFRSHGVDRPADIPRVEALLRSSTTGADGGHEPIAPARGVQP
ncbi:hypothetical protein JW905_07215, partial [bacterium]|nr:hypothetical protein [candidate division CSSED10-310 bacterium]